MMSSCKKASVLMSGAHDRPLTFVERLRLRTHLAVCERCRRVERQLDFLREALRRYRERD